MVPLAKQERSGIDGPNVKIFWVEMKCEYSAASLARSWREGRISLDAPMEFDGVRMPFRQLCQNIPWLRSELGNLSETLGLKRRSWFEERKFRREAWRRVVENGELGLALLTERIERLSQDLEISRNECHAAETLLEAAHKREKDLVAAIIASVEDARELESIFNVCVRSRVTSSESGVDCLGQYQIFEHLAENLLEELSKVVDGSTQNLREPDLKRIEQVVLFYKESKKQIDKSNRRLDAEKREWAKEFTNRKKRIEETARNVTLYVQSEIATAKCQAEALIQHYRQTAALFANWRESVEEVLFEKPCSGTRYMIGRPMSLRKDWVRRAIFSYAQMVAPDDVLAIFKGGLFLGANIGFLVSWYGLHWRMSRSKSRGFLQWGWTGKLIIKRGILNNVNVSLDSGENLGSIWCAGPEGEIESFLTKVDEANHALPVPSFGNVAIESFRRITSLAAQDIRCQSESDSWSNK